jgi:hypothetical protein
VSANSSAGRHDSRLMHAVARRHYQLRSQASTASRTRAAKQIDALLIADVTCDEFKSRFISNEL